MDNSVIKNICVHFNIKGELLSVTPICEGLINSTFLVVFDTGEKYMLQKINTYVFKNPRKLMENIIGVTQYVNKRIIHEGGDTERGVLNFLMCDNGKYFYADGNSDCWRAYYYVDNAITYNKVDSPKKFRSAGKAFGHFMKLLSEYPANSLHETIVNFHNTTVRYKDFLDAVERDAYSRRSTVSDLIAFVTDREDDMGVLVGLLESGELPMRVTHNDTKLNNVLFDKDTDESICVIDLDTVMPGLSLYDFGDSIRSGANTADEDEKDLSKVGIDLDLFESYVEGYLSETSEFLTDREKENLVFAAKLMTLECGMRFLTDYLNGDKYFRINYSDHNLVRTRNQFRLVEDMENKKEEMEKIVRKYI